MKLTLLFQLLLFIITPLITNLSNAQTNQKQDYSKNVQLSKNSNYVDVNVAGFSQFTINYERKKYL